MKARQWYDRKVSEAYREVCGTDVKKTGADLKRLASSFAQASERTGQQYVRAKRRGDLGINGRREKREFCWGDDKDGGDKENPCCS